MATKLAKIIGDFRTTLSSEIAVGGTSATIQSATDQDGVSLPAGTYLFTLDKANSQKEHIVCTLSGTSLSSIKSVSRQGVQTAGVARKHRIGATIEITDFAHLKYINDLLDGTTALNSALPLAYDAAPTFAYGSNQLVTWDKAKDYADSLTYSGAPDGDEVTKGVYEGATVAEQGSATDLGSTGAHLVPLNKNLVKTSSGAGDANKIPVLGADGTLANGFIDKVRTWGTVQSFTADNCQITSDPDSANDATRYSRVQSAVSASEGLGTSGEAFAVGAPLYLKTSNGKLYRCDADADESTFSFVGFALEQATAADQTKLFAKPGGIATGLSGLTAGSYYYISGTTGTISTTPGARFAKVGQAMSTTTLRVIEPKFIVRGSQAVTAVTTYTQTTGFYPAHIEIRCVGSNAAGSVGDDTNTCLRLAPGTGGTMDAAAKAYIEKTTGGTVVNSGTVSSKTATGFVLNNDANIGGSSTTVYWTAFSE